MKRWWIAGLAALGTACAAAPLKKNSRPQPGVSWSNAVVRASGSGPPDVSAPTPEAARMGAERAAKADAIKDLFSQVKGVRIRAGTTVGEEMENDELRARVSEVLSGFKTVTKRYYADGGLEIDVELPLAALTELWIEPLSTAPAFLGEAGRPEASGLVVDARGLKVQPVLTPRLLDAEGNVLYEATMLSPDARKVVPVASWVGSLDEAKKNPRLGGQPLTVKVGKVKGSDLMLTEAEAKKLTDSGGRYLAEGRVVIVAQ